MQCTRAMAAIFVAAMGGLTGSTGFAQIRDPAPPQAARPATTQADVPVRQVVLFSSGVGYFEHYGTVRGDGAAELRFKTDQINDVLKSLVLQDLDKGQVGSVSYASEQPLEKALKSFQVDITKNPPLADLLGQLRGARVEVTLADGNARGTIVGVEKRHKELADKTGVIDADFLNLKVGSRFRSIPLDTVRDFALEDPKLEEELDKALSVLAGARDQDKKPVTIQFRGQGERRVRMGYVVETPIWKTSYRLMIAGAPNAAARAATQPGTAPTTQPGAAPTTQRSAPEGKLQGWAIVENQTDNDWNDVQLSLVSGRPISFIEDLYHPLYVPRPVVQPQLYASLRPQTYAGGISDEELKRSRAKFTDAPDFNLQAAGDARGGRGGGGGSLFGSTSNAPATAPAIDPTASVAAAASAGQLGELFEFTVGNVSLPRQRSAMIPILTDDLEVERLSIYNPAVLETHPLNGARIKNTTGKHLLQGPVTVLEAGSYAGDACIDDLPPGQQRLLSYGVDLNITVDASDFQVRTSITASKIVKGMLELTRKEIYSTNYVLQNKGAAGRTVIIEHARGGPDWTLTEPRSTEETTNALFRLRTSVAAGKTIKLPVRSEHVAVQQIALLQDAATADGGPVAAFLQSGEISGPVKQALVKAMQLKQALAETQRQIDEKRKNLAEVSPEQTRIRENIKTVAPNSDYATRLMKKLDEQETQIEQMQKEVQSLQKSLETQRKDLENYLSTLEVG